MQIHPPTSSHWTVAGPPEPQYFLPDFKDAKLNILIAFLKSPFCLFQMTPIEQQGFSFSVTDIISSWRFLWRKFVLGWVKNSLISFTMPHSSIWFFHFLISFNKCCLCCYWCFYGRHKLGFCFTVRWANSPFSRPKSFLYDLWRFL